MNVMFPCRMYKKLPGDNTVCSCVATFRLTSQNSSQTHGKTRHISCKCRVLLFQKVSASLMMPNGRHIRHGTNQSEHMVGIYLLNLLGKANKRFIEQL